jgi:trimeric autotransporter adhesin
MKTTSILRLCLLAAISLSALSLRAQGTTAFTYQGQLHDSGTNANGSYTMIFKLYDAASGGNLIGAASTNALTLANGLFTVNLDFGANAFTGGARWLDITAVIGGTSQTLTPRVALLPAPYAIYANTAGSLIGGGWNATVGNYQSYSNVFGIFANGNLILGMDTNGIIDTGNFQAGNLNANNLSLNGQLNLGSGSIFFSGTNGGGTSLASDGNMGIYAGGNLVVQNNLNFGNGGGSLSGDGQGGIVSQSGLSVSNLTVTGNSIFFPQQSGASLTVTNGGFSFDNNVKIGALGTISLPTPDHQSITLTGYGSGSHTLGLDGALQAGSLILANNGTTVSMTANNGGFYIPGGIFTINGPVYASAFNTTSDRNAKENFTAVNPQEILERVARLPISGWNFKDDAATRHIGPMAQDFYSSFQVGTDERHIATVDEDGVALAAIQGLNQKLETELKTKDAKISELEERLNRLEAALKSTGTK